MAKKVYTQYTLPITDAEKEEIKGILTPIYIQNEKREVAKQLHSAVLGVVDNNLRLRAPNYMLADHESAQAPALNTQIKQAVTDWYDAHVLRLGPDIKPEDVFIQISEDGLYILTYSDTAKSIILDTNFEFSVPTISFPDTDIGLVRQVNEHLEKEATEE